MPHNIPREQFQALLDIAMEYHVAGVVIANLQKDRSLLSEQSNTAIQNISG